MLNDKILYIEIKLKINKEAVFKPRLFQDVNSEMEILNYFS